MRPADEISQLIKQMKDPVSENLDQKIRTEIDQALTRPESLTETDSDDSRPRPWRIIMKPTLSKIAAVFVIALSLWGGTQLFNSTSRVVWADVLEEFSHALTFSCRTRTQLIDPPAHMSVLPELEVITYVSQGHGMRSDQFVDGKLVASTYVLPGAGVHTIVSHEDKTYTALDGTSLEAFNQNLDPRAFVEEFKQHGYRILNRKILQGMEIEGIEFPGPDFMQGVSQAAKGRLWVDVQNARPVLMEIELRSGDVATRITIDDFKWDTPLEASLFELRIPSDYRPAAQGPETSGDEAAALNGLRNFAELSGGWYPSALDRMSLARDVARALARSVRNGGELKADTGIRATAEFYHSELVRLHKDPAYYGDRVTATDTQAVLLRWKISENSYRVVFGDLSVGTVSPNELAELEAELPAPLQSEVD